MRAGRCLLLLLCHIVDDPKLARYACANGEISRWLAVILANLFSAESRNGCEAVLSSAAADKLSFSFPKESFRLEYSFTAKPFGVRPLPGADSFATTRDKFGLKSFQAGRLGFPSMNFSAWAVVGGPTSGARW